MCDKEGPGGVLNATLSVTLLAGLCSLALAVPNEAHRSTPTVDPPEKSDLRKTSGVSWKQLQVAGVAEPVAKTLRLEAKLLLDVSSKQRLRLNLASSLRVNVLHWQGKPFPYTRSGDAIELSDIPPARSGTLLLRYSGRPRLDDGLLTRQDITPRMALLVPGGRWWPSIEGLEVPETVLDIQWPKSWKVFSLPGGRAGERAVRFSASPGPALLAGPYREKKFAGVNAHFLGPPPADSTCKSLQAFWEKNEVPLGTSTLPCTWFELPEGFAPLTENNLMASRRPPGGERALLNALIWLPRTPGVASEPERILLTEGLGAAAAEWMDHPHESSLKRLRIHEETYGAFLRQHAHGDVSLQQAWSAEPATWAVLVRDKAGMAWAMLREIVGRDGFLKLMREWARVRQTGGGTWQDFLALVPPQAALLRTWSEQTGLPTVKFEAVRVEARADKGWAVSGCLLQRGPLGLQTELALVSADGIQRVPFRTFAPRTPFSFVTHSRPLRLVLDGSERAPWVRRHHLKVSDATRESVAAIVYGASGPEELRAATERAAGELAVQLRKRDGIDRPIYKATALPSRARQGSLIVLGTPGVNDLTAAFRDQFPVRFVTASGPNQEDALWWQGRAWRGSDHGVVQIIANPMAPEHTILLLAGLTPKAQMQSLDFLAQASTYVLYGPQGVQEGNALRPFPDLEYPLY